MRFKFAGVELCLRGLMRLYVGQFPLPCGLRDFPTDVAFNRIAGQDDLGAACIVEDRL